jgi:hypothetical protein
MYYSDHAPPHFHAIYGSDEAVVAIQSARLIAGKLPKRALGLVRTWAHLHRQQLFANWAAAREARPLEPIDPLS